MHISIFYFFPIADIIKYRIIAFFGVNMCQLNVFLVSDNVGKEKVIGLMKKYLGFNAAECVEGENLLIGAAEGFSLYVSGGMRCNCGSVISSLKDEELDFEKYYEKNLRKNVERLEKIKAMMLNNNYKKRKKALEKQMNKFSEEMQELNRETAKLERDLTELIFNDKTLSDEEKSRKMHEEVYPLINKKLRETDESEAMKNLQKRQEEFLRCGDNELLLDSCSYTLKKRKPKKITLVPLFSEDGEEETVTMPSDNIDDAIAEAKDNKEKTAAIREYKEIVDFIEAVRKEGGKVKIFSFRQDGEAAEINGEREMDFTEMSVDSLASLPYNVLLSIV